MNVINLEEYKSRVLGKRPRTITFHSSVYQDTDGASTTFSIRVHVEDGNVFDILEDVVANGGIGQIVEDGVFKFIPWPCAVVKVEDV